MQTEEKISRLNNYLSGSFYWWNRKSVMKDKVERFKYFSFLAENNFGMNSTSMKNLAEQIGKGSFTKKMVNAIHSFYREDYLWNELLGTDP